MENTERSILHSDANNFYASVECLYNPSLHGKPIAVAGNVEERHGIVLAKSNEAKACGVKTGDVLWHAKQKCPDIMFIPPHYDLYLKHSKMLQDIYADYTDRIEPFGLDEAWIDVTGSSMLFGSGEEIAQKIRKRVKTELGITVSIGVSYNKVFSKLGSDMKKPDAVTVITKEDFKEKVWKLPVNEMIFVGYSTLKKLMSRYIYTIGELARTEPGNMNCWLGKTGLLIWGYANGFDSTPVSAAGVNPVIKSIGNSTTAPQDILTESDAKMTLMMLSESVSARLREHEFVCETVQLSIRSANLSWIERQAKLDVPNRTSKSIFDLAMSLFKANHDGQPVRGLGVRASQLKYADFIQLSFLSDCARIFKHEELETAVDGIRNRFGHSSLQRGVMLTDFDYSKHDFKKEHLNTFINF